MKKTLLLFAMLATLSAKSQDTTPKREINIDVVSENTYCTDSVGIIEIGRVFREELIYRKQVEAYRVVYPECQRQLAEQKKKTMITYGVGGFLLGILISLL